MDKRLAKRHKRQVMRAKKHSKLSEPESRTPKEIRAAREASRPPGIRRNDPTPVYASRSQRSQSGAVSGNMSKAED